MEEETCPNCEESLSIIKLGAEPARQVCNRFGCDFDGRTISRKEAEAQVNA